MNDPLYLHVTLMGDELWFEAEPDGKVLPTLTVWRRGDREETLTFNRRYGIGMNVEVVVTRPPGAGWLFVGIEVNSSRWRRNVSQMRQRPGAKSRAGRTTKAVGSASLSRTPRP